MDISEDTSDKYRAEEHAIAMGNAVKSKPRAIYYWIARTTKWNKVR